MQLKDILFLFGIKSKTREYGFSTETIKLPIDGELTIAQWQHPKSAKIEISLDEINSLRLVGVGPDFRQQRLEILVPD